MSKESCLMLVPFSLCGNTMTWRFFLSLYTGGIHWILFCTREFSIWHLHVVSVINRCTGAGVKTRWDHIQKFLKAWISLFHLPSCLSHLQNFQYSLYGGIDECLIRESFATIKNSGMALQGIACPKKKSCLVPKNLTKKLTKSSRGCSWNIRCGFFGKKQRGWPLAFGCGLVE